MKSMDSGAECNAETNNGVAEVFGSYVPCVVAGRDVLAPDQTVEEEVAPRPVNRISFCPFDLSYLSRRC